MVGSGPWHRDHTPPTRTHACSTHAQQARPRGRGKRLKWHRFTIFRALRAPSTATAPKKCLPESVFSGRTPKTTFASAGRTNLVAGSPFQSLLSPSCYFLSAQRLCDDVKIVAKIRWGLEEVSLYILEYGKNIAPNRVYILEYSLYSG